MRVDAGSIPGSWRSPEGGNDNPFQCSHLENPVDRGAWWATVHGIARESDMTDHVQTRSVAQLCPTLCDAMLCSTPGPSVLHYLWVCSNSCSLGRWCHLTISFSAAPFSFCLQSFPVSGSFLMSQLFAWGDQSIGASSSSILEYHIMLLLLLSRFSRVRLCATP